MIMNKEIESEKKPWEVPSIIDLDIHTTSKVGHIVETTFSASTAVGPS